MPVDNPKAYKNPQSDPLGEYASAGEFKNLNVTAGGFEGGQNDGGADKEAAKGLAEFAGLGRREKTSSTKGPEKVTLPAPPTIDPLG